MKYIDINSDLGEGFGPYRLGEDEGILDVISTANIACGFHGGDPVIMGKTVAWAREKGVALGAHPGYPDLMGFGRRDMDLSREELRAAILYQVGALMAHARAQGAKLNSFKLHGALANRAHAHSQAGDHTLTRTVGQAILDLEPGLIMLAFAGSAMAQEWAKMGLRVAHEIYLDRAYNSDGTLVDRRSPGAVLQDIPLAVERAVQMIETGKIPVHGGGTLTGIPVETLCVHSDTAGALAMAQALAQALGEAHITIQPLK